MVVGAGVGREGWLLIGNHDAILTLFEVISSCCAPRTKHFETQYTCTLSKSRRCSFNTTAELTKERLLCTALTLLSFFFLSGLYGLGL